MKLSKSILLRQVFQSLPPSTQIRGAVHSLQFIFSEKGKVSFRSISTATKPESSVFYNSNIKYSDRLQDRICLITGGSSGIGHAIAERFLHEGARRVVITGRNEKRLLTAMEKLQLSLPHSPEDSNDDSQMKNADKSANESGRSQPDGKEISADSCRTINFSSRISALAGDVGQSEFWTSAPWKTTLDGIDILVNVAGVSHSSRLMRAEDDHIDSMLKTNLQGAIFATREMTRRVPRQQNSPKRSKSIINVSSLLAFKGAVGTAAYASTKAGLIGLTRAVAVESSRPIKGTRIRANAIVPGYIETKMLDEMGAAGRAKALESIPLDRFGTPEEVADAAVFLATNEYANNCILNIDGGLSAV